jgi:hypothetical protein
MRAGLAVHGHPSHPRRFDLFERPPTRHVHHVRRRPRELGENEEAMNALGFERDRAAAEERVDAEPALIREPLR